MRASARVILSVIAAALVPLSAYGQSEDAASPVISAADASIPPSDAPAAQTEQAPTTTDPNGAQTAATNGSPQTNNSATTVTISTPRVALVDTAPIGVDAAAGTFVNTVLREQFQRLGFTLVPTEELYASARRLALGFPVPEQGLATLVGDLRAEMAFACDLRARSGYYFATVRVRRADEQAERSLAVVATQWTLGDRVREAVVLLLRGANQTSVTNASPSLSNYNGPVVTPTFFNNNVSIPPRRPVLVHPRPFELGLLGHGAFNPGRDPYTNALFGLRFAYFPLDRLGVSASLSYTNLRGRVGRVHNVLPTVGVESAVDLVPTVGLFVPVRAELGYLPFNGPVVRFTAGLAFTLYRQLRLELDIVQPTIWWVNENVSVSLDVGAYLTWTFGRDRTPRERRRRRRPTPNTNANASASATANTSAASTTPSAAPSNTPAPAAQ
jgi:hypothetical protein